MNSLKKIVLLSVKPIFAKKIKSREKTLELRRTAPKITAGDIIVIYETNPIQRVTSYCHVNRTLNEPPEILWEKAKDCACIGKAEYDKYFLGKELAHGIELETVIILETPKKLSDIWSKSFVPQNYCYLQENEFCKILE